MEYKQLTGHITLNPDNDWFNSVDDEYVHRLANSLMSLLPNVEIWVSTQKPMDCEVILNGEPLPFSDPNSPSVSDLFHAAEELM